MFHVFGTFNAFCVSIVRIWNLPWVLINRAGRAILELSESVEERESARLLDIYALQLTKIIKYARYVREENNFQKST